MYKCNKNIGNCILYRQIPKIKYRYRASTVKSGISGSVVEHRVSNTKGCGFDSQGTHILKKEKYSLKLLWIKASAKCIRKCNILQSKNSPHTAALLKLNL